MRHIRSLGAKIAFPVALLASGAVFSSSAYADQPNMHDAVGQLMAARATLAAATPDKGGHRLRAIALVDHAIAEVRAGMAYSRGK